MPTEIECKPVGLQTDAGVERVTTAFSTFNTRTTEVANLACEFIRRYNFDLAQMSEELADDAVELHDAITAREDAQEELLRAIGGAEKVGA